MPLRLICLAVALSVSFAPALKFDAPKAWMSKTPSSTMRLAEFALPKADGDPEDASLVVYFFGTQGGGGVQANIDRWVGQMTQPDGRSSASLATTTKMTAHDLAISLVDVTGTYTAEVSPGAAEHFNKPGFRQRAAVVEGTGGPYYVKLLGPAKTVAKWDAEFLTFLKSLRVE